MTIALMSLQEIKSSSRKFSLKDVNVFSKSKTPVIALLQGFGVPGGIRTPGLLIRSQTLYPAELQALTTFLFYTNLRLLSTVKFPLFFY